MPTLSAHETILMHRMAASLQEQPIGILILEHTIASVIVKFSCQNSHLFQSYQNCISLDSQSCCLLKFLRKIQVNLPIIGVSLLNGFWPAGLFDTINFWGENIHLLFVQQKLSYWQSDRDRCYLISIFYYLSSLSNSLHVYIRRNQVWCVKFNFFCTPESRLRSRAQLQSGSNLPFIMIMSTMILHSLENSRLRKEKSPWMKSPFEAYLLEAPAESKISKHLFLLFEGFRAPTFAKKWRIGW